MAGMGHESQGMITCWMLSCTLFSQQTIFQTVTDDMILKRVLRTGDGTHEKVKLPLDENANEIESKKRWPYVYQMLSIINAHIFLPKIVKK